MSRKQIVALLLAVILVLSLIGCGKTPPSAETNTAQGEQQMPEEKSESPETTDAPMAAETPEAPEAPTESEQPEETEQPKESEEPETPEESEKPGTGSEEPVDTEEQEVNIYAFEPVQISPSDLASIKVLSMADYSNMDRLSYDCTDADAEERAIDFILIPYNDLYYTYFDDVPSASYLGPDGEYLMEQTPDPLGQIPVSTDTYNCYQIAPGDNVDWLLRNVFNIEPSHPENAVLVNSTDFSPMRYYWHDGSYYCENPYGIGDNLVIPTNTFEDARRSGDYLYGRLHSEPDTEKYVELFGETDDMPEPKDLWVLLRQKNVGGELVWSLCYMGQKELLTIRRYVNAASEAPSGPPAEPNSARAIFEDFFAQGGWVTVMDALEVDPVLDLDYRDAEVQAALVDVDRDGMEELVLQLQFFMMQGSCLLDIDETGEVQIAQTAFNGGGSGGGYAVEIRYDTEEQRPVAVLNGYFQIGFAHGTRFLETFGNDLTVADLEIKRTHYHQDAYTSYQEEMDRIREETDLWVEDDGYLVAYTKNGEYITRDEFESLEARYVTPEDPALQLQKASPYYPVPQI